MTVTSRHITVRVDRGAHAASVTFWNNDPAGLVCGDLNDPSLAEIVLKFHTLDGSTLPIYWQLWMKTWWEDPIDGVYGTHWLTPAWWAPTSDVVWDAYRYGQDSPFFPTTGQPDAENGFGIVSQENVDSWGNEVSTNPWWWKYDQVPIGKHVWIQGWARLWYWTGDTWGQVTWPMYPSIAATDAPTWCFY